MDKECVCTREDLEQGDTLYIERDWMVVIRPIKYCPICGKELPNPDDN